jgi:hypothetical protein
MADDTNSPACCMQHRPLQCACQDPSSLLGPTGTAGRMSSQSTQYHHQHASGWVVLVLEDGQHSPILGFKCTLSW